MEYSWAKRGFFGGHALLDFVNTVDDEGKTRGLDAIPDWPTAIEWATTADVIDGAEAKALTCEAGGAAVRRELDALHAFRELAWNVLSDVAADRAADRAQLDELGEVIRWALGQAVLRQDGRSVRWGVSAHEPGAGLLRARLAIALSDLMAREDLGRLRECGRCTGLFLDRGRGVGRRWCRMEICGNRTKIERYRGKATGDRDQGP